LLPGSNLFIATHDATSPPDEDGNRVVVCTNLGSRLEQVGATKAVRLLSRIAGELVP